MTGCYAGIYRNCQSPISLEHFISESILEQLGSISSEGIPWLKGKNISIKATSVAAKCLCKWHNESLSGLDEMAGFFFKELETLYRHRKMELIIPGHQLERWLLKLLIGHIGTGTVKVDGKTFGIDLVPQEWLDILFEDKPFNKKIGLYFHYTPGRRIHTAEKLNTTLITYEGKVVGLTLILRGIQFLFTMLDEDIAFNKKHPQASSLMRHPNLVRINKRSQLTFIW